MSAMREFKVGDRATFTYHEKRRVGIVVEVHDSYLKLEVDEGVFRSFSYGKMSDIEDLRRYPGSGSLDEPAENHRFHDEW